MVRTAGIVKDDFRGECIMRLRQYSLEFMLLVLGGVLTSCNDGAKFYGQTGEPALLSHAEETLSPPPSDNLQENTSEEVGKGIGEVSDLPGSVGTDQTKGGELPTPMADPLATLPKVPTTAVFERSFLAGEMVSQVSIVDSLTSEVSEAITLKGIYDDASQTYIVPDTPTQLNTFTQGHGGEKKIVEYTAKEAGLLDILVVVDNSSSMSEEQAKLAPQLEPLLSYIDQTNWRIGFIKTEHVDNSCLHAIIEKGTDRSVLAANFRSAVNVGTKLGTEEEGIRQAHLALTCTQTPWLRTGSSLAILIVSDEDNCTNGLGCPSSPWKSEEPFIEFLKTIREVGETARVYGLYWQPEKKGQGKSCATGNAQANIYQRLVKETKGTDGSICAESYDDILRAISLDMKQIIRTQFPLASVPNAGTVKVLVDNKVLPSSKFSTSGSIVEIEKDQNIKTDAIIKIEYEVGGTPLKKDFTLASGSYKIRENELEVFVNDVLQHSSQYKIKGDTISFMTPPPDYAKIQVKYKRDEPKEKKYTISKDVKKKDCKLLINNREAVKGIDYLCDEKTSEAIVLADIKDKDEIKFLYKAFRGKKLKYQVNVKSKDYETAKNTLTVVDAKTGDPVNVLLEDESVVISENDFLEEREILVKYKTDLDIFKIDISGQDVMEDSIKVTGVSTDCKEDDVTVSATEIILKCAAQQDEKIMISYQILKEIHYSYLFDLMENIENHSVSVFINGEETKDFLIKKNNVILAPEANLEASDKILIKVKIKD